MKSTPLKRYTPLRSSGKINPTSATTTKEKRDKRKAKAKLLGHVSNRTIEKRLDVLWRKAVKIRAGYHCEVCLTQMLPTIGEVQSHHFQLRRHNMTRWDIENGLCVCLKCHQSLQLNPNINTAVFMSIRGVTQGKRLAKLAHTSGLKPDYDVLERELKAVISGGKE